MIIRMSEGTWRQVHDHLFSSEGEHFAFLRARVARKSGVPIFLVREAILIPDGRVQVGHRGYSVTPEAVVDAVNAAVRAGDALIEAHNHGGNSPRFSVFDDNKLPETVTYMHRSLPGRPYAATVWGGATVYGRCYEPDQAPLPFDSITAAGSRLRQLVSRDDDQVPVSAVFARQLPWFTPEGQRHLARLKVGIVGAGGTGSHMIQGLAYLGCRDFVLVDHDKAEDTNLNRLVTATPADLSTPKVIIGRRLIRSIAPDARVTVVAERLQTRAALAALTGVDILFGCLDDDGPRLILNQLALAYRIPLFDLGVGLEAADGQVAVAGGRVAVVLPGGPCLHCMHALNIEQARFSLSSPEEQARHVERGYVRGMDIEAPSVVSLNGLIANAAIIEFAVFVSGIRPVNPYTMLDLIGRNRSIPSQWLTPTLVKRDPGCVECTLAGIGDEAHLERYVPPEATPGG